MKEKILEAILQEIIIKNQEIEKKEIERIFKAIKRKLEIYLINQQQFQNYDLDLTLEKNSGLTEFVTFFFKEIIYNYGSDISNDEIVMLFMDFYEKRPIEMIYYEL